MNLMRVIAMLQEISPKKYFEDPTITIFNILHHLHVINKEIGLTEIDDVLSLGDVLILTLPKVKVT